VHRPYDDWRVALSIVLLAGVFDVALGEPPTPVHPVVWMGRLIGALERRRPHDRPAAEFAYGVGIVAVTAGTAAGAGLALDRGLRRLPWWLALPAAAYALKTAFSLRGLVAAGRDVQQALGDDTDAARERLSALVSRSPDLEEPLIVSATVESLAENLTDSVVSPLLAFALLGLPGALAYRAINTMDAMLGYRDHREYVGKAAARSDDAANWLPTRLTGLLLVGVAGLRGRAGRAWWAFRTQHRPEHGPNKTLAIATMAGALGVRLQKPGVYALGEAERPLTPDVIGDAARVVWTAGGVAIGAAAALAALVRAVRS
jgi:adenosylcobinamide-phosphate synthase